MKKVFNQFQYWLKNHFGFSYREANGFMVIIALIIFLLLAPMLYDLFIENISLKSDKDQQKLDSLVAIMDFKLDSNTQYQSKNYPEKYSDPKLQNVDLQYFDPNTCSKNDFLNMGLYPNIADRIIKYREKGGKFKVPQDLKKIYGFSPSLYQKLEPYIKIQTVLVDRNNPKKDFTKNFKEFEKVEIFKIDINTADSISLMKLKGIGFKLASRVIKYRSMLGGFVSQQQFSEIYGLDTSVINILKNNTTISGNINKLDINIADFNTLRKHPYIGYTNAKIIVAFRKTHSKIDHINQIKLIDLPEDKKTELEKYLLY